MSARQQEERQQRQQRRQKERERRRSSGTWACSAALTAYSIGCASAVQDKERQWLNAAKGRAIPDSERRRCYAAVHNTNRLLRRALTLQRGRAMQDLAGDEAAQLPLRALCQRRRRRPRLRALSRAAAISHKTFCSQHGDYHLEAIFHAFLNTASKLQAAEAQPPQPPATTCWRRRLRATAASFSTHQHHRRLFSPATRRISPHMPLLAALAAAPAPPLIRPSPPAAAATAQAPTTALSMGPPWLAVIIGASTAWGGVQRHRQQIR